MIISSAIYAQGPDRVFRVEVDHVEEIELSKTLELTGSLDPWQEIALAALARGRLVSIPVEEGQHVQKDELLFKMDDREEQIALRSAKAELDKALSERKKMKSGSQPQEIVQAQRAADVARSRKQAAQDEWNRLRPLADDKIISQSEATKAKSDLDVAESLYEQAQASLALVEDGFRSEEIQFAEAEVNVRQAAVDDILRRIEDLHVRAPEDGAITSRAKEPGEWASEGESVIEMVVLDPMKLRLEIPQSQIGFIKPGQLGSMTVDGLDGETFKAKVTQIIPQATRETRNFPVTLQVENPGLKLSAGMFARASIQVGEKYSGLAVPRESLQYRGEKLVIYVVEPMKGGATKSAPAVEGAPVMPAADSIAREVEIKIREELKEQIVVEPVGAKLKAGDEIVMFGGSRLRNGSHLLRLNPSIPGAG